MSALFGLRLRHQTTMDDDLESVQRYPVELWPETRPVVGRSSWFEPISPYYYYYRGPYQVAMVLGRGKLPKIDVAPTNWEEYQGKLLGERLRQQGACRGLDIRAAKFVSRLSEFQAFEF